ncbi:MAG: class I SAM-dependent DNA methyltransferase [Gemmatimonadetes bacterium]|nr:class I SAM-dependent DNA methyltransferase [Gemmatimonadota bacterium]
MTPRQWDIAAIAPRIAAMMGNWDGTTANEQAALQGFILDLCQALGVAPPNPPRDEYRFEYPVQVVDRDGNLANNRIDCYRAEHFALEGKATGQAVADDNRMRKAFGQVRTYVAHVSGNPPPFLMVLDLPRHLMVWDRWSGRYGDFAAGRRINLSTLHTRPEEIALLCDIFEQPWVRDPRARAQAVTKEIAAKLAELAAALENRVGDQERVARFLMRCVFSCFSEDVGLLPTGIFQRTLEVGLSGGGADQVARALTSLWQTMDTGGMYGAEQLARFNGHFFQTVEALPLEPREVQLLIEAARFDWSRVEPSIFGTLLVRALDPAERHRLGAEYTPREYIERLIEPTVVEPLRERWTAVQGAVLQLEEAGTKKDRQKARGELRVFHEWLRSLHFLDPACGSGNFLYVTLAAVKRIELEVLNEIQRLSDGQGGLVLDEVHPRQFHGIEIKPWAREIAELTLWIGYHQFWRDTHGGRTPPTPILEDTGTLECRDAVLAWDEIVHRPGRDRPDPTPRVRHPVTGELVPDPEAKLPYYEYVGARAAEWPRADFIVGNPPYIGWKYQREAFGDGYVDALRAIYRDLPDSADLVMYWWARAATAVANGRVVRAGLITTNSITQQQNREVAAKLLGHEAAIVWAIADHPWIAESDGAAVRIAMTVTARPSTRPQLLRYDSLSGSLNELQSEFTGSDLKLGIVATASDLESLRSNQGMAHVGFQLNGQGFVLRAVEAERLLDSMPDAPIRPLLSGRDLSAVSRRLFVIDFGLMEESRARAWPVLFDIVRARVKPERDANARASRRIGWWKFGEPNPSLRAAAVGTNRVITTSLTARHRSFQFVDAHVAFDSTVVGITSDDAAWLGVLSSRIHSVWAELVGSRLGVGNDYRYTKGTCFEAFPFPTPPHDLRIRIAALAERLDTHRKDALARDERVTMTGMYNVVEKLRSGEALTPKERTIHELAACGVLRDLHDELDALVAQAYGWPWPMPREEILERLVTLHDERVAEEKRGIIRWLRPEYQIPRFAPDSAPPPAPSLELGDQIATDATAPPRVAVVRGWPGTAVEQLSALGALLSTGPVTVDEAVAAFDGARRELVARHLETLALMGEVSVDADGQYGVVARSP